MKKQTLQKAFRFLTLLCLLCLGTYAWGQTTVTFGSDWNALFGTSYSGSISSVKANKLTLSGSVNGVSFVAKNGSSTNGYVKTSDFRAYNGYTITITAPTGQNITAINSTKGGKTFSSGISSNVGVVSISNNAISWTGSANSVVLSVSGTVSFATITVTHATAKTLQSIAVSGTPTKTVYEAGEALDPAGLTVTGTYDDESQETITEGITWTFDPETLSAGTTSCTVTATVDEISSEGYVVNGLTVTSAKTLIGIEASGTPEEFWKGDAFNHNGITINATWDDESTTDVTEESEFSTPDMTTAGEKTVTVTYKGEECSYKINVKTIANTAETAYTTAEAIAIIDAGKDLSTEVYVKGTVSKVDSYNKTYKSITYWLDNNDFQIYSGKGIDGADFESINDIAVDAEVVVKGIIKKYNTTYEMDKNNQLVSYKAPETPKTTATLEFTTYQSALFEGNEDVITVTYNGDGTLSANSTDTEVATVSLDGTTLTVTAIAAGTTTISVSAPATDKYTSVSKEYNLTVKVAPTPAELPFSFTGGVNDIESTQGMSQSGLGTDYKVDNTKLKFDGTGDNVIIYIEGQAGVVSYMIKSNGFSGGTYEVMESANGSDYTTLATYTALSSDAETKANNLKADTRYIKFVYTSKSSGNVGLGNINIFNGRVVTIPGTAETEEDCGMTTLYVDYATVVPAECKAYYAGSAAEGQVNLVKAIDNVAANQGVLVYGKKGASFTFAETADEVAAPAANLFVGSTTTSETPCVASDNIFYLSTDGTFKQLVDGTRKAYKAYLHTEVDPGTKGFTLNFDGETSINDVNVNVNDNVIYNLAGQRVNKLQKGINIVNGKKVLY